LMSGGHIGDVGHGKKAPIRQGFKPPFGQGGALLLQLLRDAPP
jgi:hypothetical protein